MRNDRSVFDEVKRKGAMHIISATGAHGSVRFSDLKSHLPVSEPTIATRLDELQDAGLLDRTFHDEMPPRVEYSLTGEAEGLYEPLVDLFEWASEQDETGAPDTPNSKGQDGQEHQCICCGIGAESGTDHEDDDVIWYRTLNGLIAVVGNLQIRVKSSRSNVTCPHNQVGHSADEILPGFHK